jgi:pyruvate kinase
VAARLAETAGADVIVAVTRVGRTATLMSSLRPVTPVLAATSSQEVAAGGCILWGITPIVTPAQEIAELEALLVARGLAHIGSVVVFVNVSAEMNRTDANFINVLRIV